MRHSGERRGLDGLCPVGVRQLGRIDAFRRLSARTHDLSTNLHHLHRVATDGDTVPLIVDLDGTLIDGDTLHLSLAMLVRRRPWTIPALPILALSGRAQFKRFVSARVSLDAAALPYRPDVVEFVRRERGLPRRILLATAADRPVAQAVAAHLGLFDDVIASDGKHNAKGVGKLQAIRAHLGEAEFDYVGDSMADLPVFRAARHAYLVCPGRSLSEAVQTGCRVAAVFDVSGVTRR